ncbi:MAG: shikimate kinase [Candidatus Zixiibacteriota bacterium]
MNTDLSLLKRIYIIGTSGCGKTTLGRQLAEALRCEHRQLDEFYWNPGWQPVENEVFLERLNAFVAQDSWILDGNFRRYHPYILPRATMIIWLDYSFPRIMYRIIKRTFVRSVKKEQLYNGNFETIRKGFFSLDSIILWAVKTFGQHRRVYPELERERKAAGEVFIRFSHPRQAEEFLVKIQDKENYT